MLRSFAHLSRTDVSVVDACDRDDLDTEIGERLRPYQKQIELACTLPGIGRLQQPAFWQKQE